MQIRRKGARRRMIENHSNQRNHQLQIICLVLRIQTYSARAYTCFKSDFLLWAKNPRRKTLKLKEKTKTFSYIGNVYIEKKYSQRLTLPFSNCEADQ